VRFSSVAFWKAVTEETDLLYVSVTGGNIAIVPRTAESEADVV
jgi:hypothetical protein